MEEVLTGVVKKDRVRFVAPSLVASADESLPRARILQEADGTAVVEVTCECGRRILLQCEYVPSNQNNQGVVQ